jgi:hypothetical protein
MSERNTFFRSLHDVSLAAWFGGSLMGVIGLNGAAAAAKDPAERLTLSSKGWARWAPVQLGILGTHAVGAIGMLVADRGRVANQGGAQGNAVVKTVLTVAAAGAAFWSASAGKTIAKHASEGAEGVTETGSGASPQLAAAQRQQKILQWVPPLLTGIVIVLTAQQGEQQRVSGGFLKRR